jgi:hypothetical protein
MRGAINGDEGEGTQRYLRERERGNQEILERSPRGHQEAIKRQ